MYMQQSTAPRRKRELRMGHTGVEVGVYGCLTELEMR
jgi:hypothetical protein